MENQKSFFIVRILINLKILFAIFQKADQTIQDVLEETLTIDDLEPNYDLVKIIKVLEELVLAGAGVDSFNEIFKLIYAKLYDEKYARDRKGELLFRQSSNPQITYDNISKLFESAKKNGLVCS